jgi:hypothetical protein
MHMKSFVRNIILSLSVIVVFLSPLSFDINPELIIDSGSSHKLIGYFENSSTDSILSLRMNITYAKTDKCNLDPGCHAVNLLESILIGMTQFFAGIAGLVLDFFLGFSISSSSYRDSGFIEAGWEIIRDFTNIVFIFALLLIAFKMVLGQDDGGAKKTLVKTILIALTINFSLFFVYAIVDSSNLLAYTFYEKIEAPEVTFSAGEGSSAEVRTSPSLSLALLQKVNPQKLLKELEGDNDTERLILIFMVGAVNIAFLFLFLSMSLLFLGRTLGLMVLAILAPFALATLTLGPKAAGMSYVGWNKWFPQLISLAFMAPVFLFFLYLTTLFSKITDTMVVEDGAGIVTSIFRVALPMLTIFALVQLSKKVATKMAGELGGQINGYVQKAAGAGLGIAAVAATGGASLAAGGVGKILGGQSTKVGKFLGSSSKVLASTKFDVSKIPGFGQALGADGSKLSKQFGNMSYSRADTGIRQGANKLRSGISDFATGRTPESVKNWEDNVQASQDKLIQRRIDNKQIKADSKPAAGVFDGISGYDAITGTAIETPITNPGTLKEELQKRRAALARRDDAGAKAEKIRLEGEKQKIQYDIDAVQDDITTMNRNGTGTPNQIKFMRSKIVELNKTKTKIDESSDAGIIKQIEKKIQNEKDTLQAELLTNDRNARNFTQDSSITISGDRRRERTDEQAARVGSGEVKTAGKVGGDADAT